MRTLSLSPRPLRSALATAALLATASLLAGCDGDPFPVAGSAPGGGDDTALCPGSPGDPDIEFIADDESHAPLDDGVEYWIEQRPQGDVTIFAPLLFKGLDGGLVVDAFSIVFTDDEGEERGSRRSSRFQLPCETDGDIAAHHYEVFFGNPGIPASAYEGLSGRMVAQLTTPDGVTVSDSIDAVLRDGTPD